MLMLGMSGNRRGSRKFPGRLIGSLRSTFALRTKRGRGACPMPELSEAQVAAVMAAILEITGSKDLQELSSRGEATMEQWREAYDIAGVPWADY